MSHPSEQLSQLLDGELAPPAADEVRAHLSVCARCEAELLSLMQLQVASRLAAPAAARLSIRGLRPVFRRPSALLGTLALAAGLLLVFLWQSGRLTQRSAAPDLMASLDGRTLEARLSYPSLAAYRPYRVMRGERRPTARLPLSALARMEARGDFAGLGAAHLMQGDWNAAADALGRAGSGPDIDNDRAVLALVRGNREEALALLDAVLAQFPRHTAALFNRGLVLQQLGLPFAAAKAFAAVAAQGEPGWSADAAARAEGLRAHAEGDRASFEQAWKDGLGWVRGQPLPTDAQLRDHPGLGRLFLYDALRVASSPSQVTSLRGWAQTLDALAGGEVLSTEVERASHASFKRRAPWSNAYLLLVEGNVPSAADQAALLSSGESDLVMGTLVQMGEVSGHLAQFVKLSQATRDPWFIALAAEQQAKAALARGAPLEAELVLTRALPSCLSAKVDYRCEGLEATLTWLLTEQHRLVEAGEHARRGLDRAERNHDWGQRPVFLDLLAQIERYRNAFGSMRAYLEEELLSQPDCASAVKAHESLASAALFQLDVEAARAELTQVPRCAGQPPELATLLDWADLFRLQGRREDGESLFAGLAELRSSPGLSPGTEAEAKAIEGEARLRETPAKGEALLRAVLHPAVEGEKRDVQLLKARSYAFSSLILESAREGNFAAALALFAEEIGSSAPASCVLGVELHDEQLAVVGRGADGKDFGQHVVRSRPWNGEALGLLPKEMVDKLATCGQVQVLARFPLQGRPGLLPSSLAWSYARARVPSVPPSQGARRHLVIAGITPPPELELPPVGDWRSATTEDAEQLLGDVATPERVLRAMKTADEVEIHAHGLAHTGLSDAAVIVLAAGEDGKYALTADAVRAQRLERAPVVLLASCYAARSAPYLHESWSLPQAFLQAGARAVLASPSEIPDDEAQPFFSQVLARIRAGSPPARALRDERESWRLKNPRSWVQTVVLFE